MTAPELAIPDLSDPRTFVGDVPIEAFRAIREKPGLYWQPTPISTMHGGYWAVTRFADILAIEKDLESFSSTRGAAYPMMSTGPMQGPSADSLMLTDPPRHTRLRKVAAKGFGPRVVANFEPWIREIVREAIADVDGRDTFDWVTEFAQTIPAYVIGRVLGIPREDRERQVAWTIAIFAATQQTEGLLPGEGTTQKTEGPQREMREYAATIQELKRANPADDMFTVLGTCVDDGEITQDEFLQWMVLMMSAGFETTHTAIGHAMRMYLEDPEVRAATDRAVDEGHAGRAVDEYIRLISPPMQMARTAIRDLEFAGTKIREGDVMVLYFLAANRDPAVFSEPDRFNPWRPERDTLAFGSGVHRCIGSYLAKLEVQVLFEELRAAGLNLRLDGEPKRGWSNFINQLTSLPVARV
jgi:cytochrome P450